MMFENGNVFVYGEEYENVTRKRAEAYHDMASASAQLTGNVVDDRKCCFGNGASLKAMALFALTLKRCGNEESEISG